MQRLMVIPKNRGVIEATRSYRILKQGDHIQKIDECGV